MNSKLLIFLSMMCVFTACSQKQDQVAAKVEDQAPLSRHLYLDVHDIGPGKVTFDGVADAHKKDLATQGEYNVNLIIKHWVDEDAGKVYCLPEASSPMKTKHPEGTDLFLITSWPWSMVKKLL